MINQESKTLREFSLTTKFSNGDNVKIQFGYDTSAKHSGYYLNASINGQKANSNATTLKRVKTLKIDVLNRIIEAIGTDVNGLPYGFDTDAQSILLTGNESKIMSYFRIDSGDDDTIELLDVTVEEIATAKNEAEVSKIATKFINAQRIRLIEVNRSLIQAIRDFYLGGVTIASTHVLPVFEGLLRAKHNPLYYKRDMDYVRKARVRLFKNVLRKKYRPF